MTERRPDISRPLAREVLVEAGHRCAIPTCKQYPVEIHHIVPWATVKEHRFENLIALCPTDHARVERGEIDRQALLIYKRNLGLIAGRYGESERRLLTLLIENPAAPMSFQQDMTFPFFYLLQDGLLAQVGFERTAMAGSWVAGIWSYALTDAGREFLGRWITGLQVE